MKKIAVIGPESTGKSTLCEKLATKYGVPWVAEYARDYLNGLGRIYRQSDLLEIARGQLGAEDQAAAGSEAPFLVCDTDLYVIKVWSEHKYHQCDPWILREIARRRYDLYLVTDIDLPWQSDPQREYPEPEMREYFFRIYQDIALASSVPWALITGDAASRLALAESAVARLMG